MSNDERVFVGTHPEDLADGRVVEPGQVVSGVDANDPHNKRLIDEGKLPLQESGLSGDALSERARELGIERRSTMSADELRRAVAEAEANDNNEEGDDGE